ncbi:YbbR-like domain-containing protein [Clostridium nigeriense]|uniref:CdaR family protein n=1 Tax=Clostridium nigeriense TaxID=1805470 RepID=UPI00082EBE66|nr:CdaR family protein [Clostridium nigeriense]
MDKKEKNRLVVPFICLLLSIGLWVYVTNVENKIRTTEITKIPVELVNLDALTSSKLALTPNQEFYVTLKVEGNTNDINKIKKSDFKVQVDLSEYAWKKGENKVPVSIVDYPITVSIRNTNNLTISINIEDMVEKSMPVTSDIRVTTKSGYFASKPNVTPEEVKVMGAESAVNKVSKLVITDKKEDVHEDIVDNYEIKPVDENGSDVLGVNLSEKIAKVEIKVSKGKSVNITIPTIGQLPSGVKLKSIDSSRKSVELLGPKEILDTINEVNTNPIDLSTITGNKDINLSVVLPEGVSVAQGEENLTARVNVISMITKEFSIKVSITGANEGMKVLPSKENVKVTIKGYQDEIEGVVADNILATLDISGYKEEGTFDVEPKVSLKGLNGNFSIEAVEKIKVTVSKEIAQVPPNNNENNND